MLNLTHYIKEIGRGKDGARDMSEQEACDLFGLVLDRQVTDLEIGAFLMATTTLVESDEELEGRLRVRHADLGLFFLCGYGLARR